MRVIGFIAVIVVALVVLAGIATALASIPDIKRYLKIREM